MRTPLETRAAGATSGLPPKGPAQLLFWRLFIINGLLFAIGTLVLALSPATVSSPVLLTEVPVLLIGLALILAANAALVRASLAPLDELTTVMRRVGLLRRGGDRATEAGNGDLKDLIRTFNEMLDRLEAENSASSALALAAQEGERQRISRELHDQIGQSLTVALLSLKRVVDRSPDDLREESLVAQEAVRASLEEVRQVAQRLRPGVLADLGLRSALSALGSEFSRSSGIPVVWELDDEFPELSGEVELVLYRIAQEALTNVARHAHATRVHFALTSTTKGLTLRILDDGQGGDLREGAGIRGMRERALLIGAELTITARPNGGTDVRLVVPRARAEG
ncbi:MAG: HAMP domain-containing sensor histidine kinase [Actinobacteria bacterium]|uniref:HAMP domain-containing sensor histidine kinase n=1 Tax=Microbacterium profundi TaxID=450380 RepID=UPI001D4B241F|nr:HAMP domain-containing sensor histidine kinase [Microbacterium profundi]MBU2111907.1 HAMP domain-containing sensor histidine kinase [Actinomycetota bacterium]MCE7482406.1 HAMP domain-containing sensor histidine kinase [Microbacterium profundi]